MDRDELNERLQPFIEKCNRRDYPIDAYSLVEAFPGDDSTSYKLEIFAGWIDPAEHSEALDVFIEKLWDETDAETRRKIFGIFIVEDELQLTGLVIKPETEYMIEKSTIYG